MQQSLFDNLNDDDNSSSLLGPFAGNKGRRKYAPIHDGGQYDCILEAFLGGGGFSLSTWNPTRSLIGADCDPAVTSVWKSWLNPAIQTKVSTLVKTWQEQVAIEPYSTFRSLAEIINRDGHPCTTGKDRIATLAAASLVIRRLCFGCFLRKTKKTKRLNIALSYKSKGSKLESFPRWQHSWPRQLDNCSVSKTWSIAVLRAKFSPYKNILAIVDPPYWVPYIPGTKRRGTGAMTAAYPEHDPSSPEFLNMCLDSTEALLRLPNVKRIVVFNYFSRELDTKLKTIARRHGMKAIRSDLDPLSNVNNGFKQRKRHCEAVWEIGGVHSFRSVQVEGLQVQGGLFEEMEQSLNAPTSDKSKEQELLCLTN